MAKKSRRQLSAFSSSNLLKETHIRRFLDNVPLQFLAFGAFIAAIVAILTAGVEYGAPAIDESRIGQVATHTIEASTDFSFRAPDTVATNRLREEAARTVPSVYDWQESLGESIQRQVEDGFSSMREALAKEARTILAEEDIQRLESIEARSTSPAVLTRAFIDTLSEGQRLGLSYELRSTHFDPRLHARITDHDFEQIARAGFPADAEQALAAIIATVMTDLIVTNPRRIEQERDQGIYLRRLRDRQLLIEYHVTDLTGRFVGLDNVPRKIDEAANQHLVAISDPQLRQALSSIAATLVRPNTSYNQNKTLEKRQIARDSVPDQFITEDFRQGQIIVDRGHLITEHHFQIIEEMRGDDETFRATQILVGVAIFSLLLLIVLYVFGRRNIRLFQPDPKDIVFMGTTLLAMLLLTRALTSVSHALAEQFGTIPVDAWYQAIPVAAGGMLIRLVLKSEHAVIFTILFAVFVAIIADNSLYFFAYTVMGSLVGVTTVQQVRHRMALMWSGFAVGAVNVLAITGFLLIQGELFQMSSFPHLLLGFAGGLAAGFFISAVLPVFETVFGYTTDIKLLELANLNHPLLRELIIHAPGSYHHSMMVGSLCEAAAETIGANSLLVRVGAYYHDVGKTKNPHYFAENQKVGENPHDKLKPNMSALIIKAHVKDGLDMARQHRLPLEIQDFIAQHHGKSLIAYFYHKAKQAEDPDIPEVNEKDFRYPGPKPQSRETAICLLADGVEAASRALPNPSPARLKGLVQTMINRAFTDGQLDECDLTLKDLNKIAQAFTRILTGIYHHRPEYPGAKKSDKRPSPKQDEREQRKKRDSGEQKTPPQKSPAKSPADSTSEVWEIHDRDKSDHGNDKDKTRQKEKDNHAGRGTNNGRGDAASENPTSDSSDSPSSREDLPRLGTS